MNGKRLFLAALFAGVFVGLFSAPLQSEMLGTLFYSPTERGALVAARSGIEQSALYTVNGIIQRKSGKSVVWINGRAMTETPQDATIPSLIIRRDHVLIEEHPIKVGETLDILSGQRGLRLPEEAVRIRP